MYEKIKESKIMVIDDNLTNLELIGDVLSFEGYNSVHSFSNPIKALEAIPDIQPDLLILDLMMPIVSGYDILSKVNTFQNQKWFMPIIVITASNNPNDRKKALDFGASDFLTKPFDLTEVSLRIKNTLLTAFLFKKEKQLSENLEQEVIKRTIELQEEKLLAERNEKKYRNLFNSNSDAINIFTLTANFPSNFIESNPSNLSVLGYRPEELKTKNIKDLILDKSDTFLDKQIKDLLQRGNIQFEAEMKCKNGSLKIIDIKCTIIDYNEQEAILSIFRDISETKIYIKTILEQSELLKSIAWSQSHEFRAPVARILGILNLIEDDQNDYISDEVKQFLNIIKISTTEMDTIIRNITKKTYISKELEKIIEKYESKA